MKKIFIAVSIGMLVAISIAGFFVMQNKKQSPRGVGLDVENIHLKNDVAQYAFRSGKVFKNEVEISNSSKEAQKTARLAMFFQWTKEDPLGFDPNLETVSFDQSIARFSQENDQLMQMIGKDTPIFPLNFLRKFSQTSQDFAIFSRDISEDNAQKLLADMSDELDAYRKAAETTRGVFSDAANGNPGSHPIAYLGGETTSTFPIMADDASKILRNADILQKEMDLRRECLEDSADKCENPAGKIEKPQNTKLDEKPPKQFLPLGELGIANDMQAPAGPFLIHSACWQARYDQYMYNASRCIKGMEYCFEKSFLADEAYYAILGKRPVEEDLKKQGVERVLQGSSAPYGCNDLTYKPKLETVDFAYANWKDKRLFNPQLSENIETNKMPQSNFLEIFSGGNQAEEDFFDARYPSDTALERLGNYYAYAYGSNMGNAGQQDELLERALLIRGKMSNFDLVANSSVFHLEMYISKKSQGEDLSQHPEYVYAIRGNYSLFFLNFSPFVWRSVEQLQFLDGKKAVAAAFPPGQPRPIITREQALQDYGQEKLDLWKTLIDQSPLKGISKE